ncbi:hypothetical protein L0657_09515 [Dyadobacter sp. CY345]|uniref:OmpP1/FadL family transporter n=1 Tax=Dyadobacter sp. CY345 TaxID=2909335 RepID=UPI001F2F3202|nr:hypothetical protein [Dyadobacter sp. CY345]MCF2444194.1 hypothetical protein [Dyadobacter sp. CY345]
MTKPKIWIGLFCSLTFSFPTFAQYASDAFRYSEINQTGSARFQGLGGNHTALGGDPSSISGNPAGLGFYSRSEVSLSPSITNFGTKTSYIDNTTSDSKSNFNLAQASLVITSQPSFQRKWKRSSLGISYSRQQSFQNRFSYSGLNNRSAYVDKVIDDANNANLAQSTLAQDYLPGTSTELPLAYSEAAAYFGMQYIYPTTSAGPPYARDDRQRASNQSGIFDSKGGQTQWTVAYAGNYDDKLYIGGSIGFTRIKYDYSHSFTDSFVNPTVFNSASQNEELSASGNGINATFGLIYKVSPTLQFGGALTSPTFMAIKETFTQSLRADYIRGSILDDNGNDVGPVENYIPVAPNDFEYSITSPLRGSVGATVFLSNKGFLTGSLEYVGYGAMRVRTNFYSASADNNAFRDDYKAEIKDTYKGAVNARLGGEYRAGIWRGRLGLAYLSDPYRFASDDINRDKLLFSLGAGVRNSRFFADISGTYNTFKSVYTPYVLNNSEDYASARITNNTVNVVLSIGTFF